MIEPNFVLKIWPAKYFNMTQVFLFLSALVIWLGVISVLLYKLFALFNKLTKGVDVGDLKQILEKVIDAETRNQKNISDLTKRVLNLEENGKLHVQKVGLIRFNPFKELGGDHSFSLAVLDGEDSGVIITSLHTRDRTRVYMKEIKKGKSDVTLSQEESKALAKAK